MVMKLSADRGDYTLIQLAMPKGLVLMPIEEVATDGCLDDEIGDMTESVGQTRSKFNQGDLRGAKRALNKAKKDMLKMEAEIKAKEGLS